MTSKSRETARGLFVKLSDAVSTVLTEYLWQEELKSSRKILLRRSATRSKGGRWSKLRTIRFTTDEGLQEDMPEKGIFYVKFQYKDKEFPVMVGVGSLVHNQIWLSGPLVPPVFKSILHDTFHFSVIEVKMSYEEIKEDLNKPWGLPDPAVKARV